VAIVVFGADVLIGYLSRADAHHRAAVRRVKASLAPGTTRLLSTANYSELLVGPLRAAGPAGAEVVDRMLSRLGIETVAVTKPLARSAASVRATTRLTLPDAFAVATAIEARTAAEDVRVESFDRAVAKAYAALT
jgi:predicted nucleic acid-binding protein